LLSFVRNASTGSNAYSAFVLRRDGGTNGIVLFTNSSTRTADGGVGNSTIRTDSGNLYLGAGSTQHILTTTGNVGIGTTSPGEKLTVSGSSYIIGVTGAVGTGTAYYLGDSSNRDLAITRVGTAAMAIGRYYPSAWAETIRFTADGNVRYWYYKSIIFVGCNW